MTDTPTPPASAPQREAEGAESVDVEFVGVTLSFPASPEDWDIDAMEAFEAQRVFEWLRTIAGADKWREIKASFRKEHKRAMKVRDIEPLAEQVAEVYGFQSAGNS